MYSAAIDPINLLIIAFFMVPAVAIFGCSRRHVVLFLFNLMFIFLFTESTVSGSYFFICLLSLVAIDKFPTKPLRFFLCLAHVCFFLGFKYFDPLRNFDNSELVGAEMPLGFSYLMFLSLSYLLNFQPSPTRKDKIFALSFFPSYIQGPFLSSRHFNDKNVTIPSGDSVWKGFIVVCKGLALISLASIFSVNVLTMGERGSLNVNVMLWVLKANVYLFYNFWGFSEVVRGLGLMLGLALPVNFNSPFNSKSLSEYWNRWHITLGSWFRNHFYFPMIYFISKYRLTQRVSPTYRNLLATFSTFLLIGFWHDVNFKFITWSVINTLLVVFSRHTNWKPWLAYTSTFAQALLVNGLFFSKDLPTYSAFLINIPSSIASLELTELAIALICVVLLVSPPMLQKVEIRRFQIEFALAIIAILFSISFNGLVSAPLYGRF